MSVHATAHAEAPPVVTCLTAGRPVPGPCTRPETRQLIPAGEAGPGAAPVVVTNFGLLFPAAASGSGGGETRPKYDLVCDDYLGGRSPTRIARRSDGLLLVPGGNGLQLMRTDTNGPAPCGIVSAMGSLAGQPIADVIVAPEAASVPAAAATVWAISGDGDGPRALHRSTDGGTSFTLAQPLPGAVFARLLAAPSDPRALYVAGYRGDTPLVLMESTDGGGSFTTHSAGLDVFQRPATGVEVLGVHPASPRVLLLAAGSPAGADEIWRSADGGASWTRVFTLQGLEVQAGFVWRALPGGGDEVLVAGRELFRQAGKPPAHLYRSTDGGLSFGQAIPSAESGPRYRCLAADPISGRLYACAGEDGDAFILGASDDGGRSWSALGQLTDIQGSRSCAAGRCLTTSIWLCETYNASCAGLAPTEPRPEAADGGLTDACSGDRCGGGGGGGGGCGCAIGGAPTTAAWWPAALTLSLCLARAGRRFRRWP
jgi:hypothetical protein